jgi:hypothetical protein
MNARSFALLTFVLVSCLAVSPALAERDRSDGGRDRSKSDSELVQKVRGVQIEILKQQVASTTDLRIQDLVDQVLAILDTMEMHSDEDSIPERVFGCHVALCIAGHLLHKFKSASGAQQLVDYARTCYNDWGTDSGIRKATLLDRKSAFLNTIEDGTFPPALGGNGPSM